MNQLTGMTIAIVVGALLPVQVAMNAHLRGWFRDPVVAALPNFIVGAAILVAYAIVTRAKLPSAASLSQVPLWAWLGGIIGASYIIATLYLGPKIGAALLLALILSGQMAASLVMDHYGWLGFPHHPVNAMRLLGAVMLVAGAILIVRS